VLNRADGWIAFRFRARDVDEPGHGTLVQPQFCQLIRQRGSITDRTFEITFLGPRRRGLGVHIRRGRLLHFVGRQIRAAGRAASDDAGWVVLVEDLQ
jgi:hypothetical protein